MALALVSCGGGSSTGKQASFPDAADTGPESVAEGLDTGVETPGWQPDDKGPEPDGSQIWEVADTDASGLAPFGAPCADNKECESGWCLTGEEGSICTQICVEECPPGWRCMTMFGLGPDVVTLCVPLAWLLCDSCEKDSDCGGGADRCLPIGSEGSWCAAQCGSQTDCPEGYECQEVDDGMQCLPETGSCICTPDLLGTTRPCEAANEFGTCPGVETCTGPAGWEACDADEPAAETCNGLDDDCDGKSDEDIGLVTCAVENDWGACPGIESCADGESVCVGPEAAMEVCDGTDNDCDALVDEDFPDIGSPCDSDDPDQCATGTWVCSQDGFSQQCAESFESPEVCDGTDNDCDGLADEQDALGCQTWFADADADGFGQPGSSVCACMAEGLFQAKQPGDCDDTDGTVNPAAVETCDGQDENCDQEVDENPSDCITWYEDEDGDGVGSDGKTLCACGPVGAYTSLAPGDCADEDPEVFPGNVEACDGKDNDCDWALDPPGSEGCTLYFPDEDLDGYGPTVKAACLCEPTLEFNVQVGGDCADDNPVVNPGASEVCNGLDDNCNDKADEPGAAGCVLYYRDQDTDGFGMTLDAFCLCGPQPPYTALWGGDCNDEDPAVNPAFDLSCTQDADCCEPSGACYLSVCIPPPSPCATQDDCANDTACTGQLCIPYSHPAVEDSKPDCTRPYKAGIFLPSVQCTWEGPAAGDPYPANAQVLSTPMVADFDFDGDPADVRPSVVFTSYSGSDGGFAASSSNGIVRILDGETCAQQFVITAAKVVGASPPAIGDIDNAADGRPEIVSFAEGGGMVAFKYDSVAGSWGLLWHSTKANGTVSDLGVSEHRWNGPAIYDLDGNGKPEILMGAVAHDSNGKIVAENLGYYPYSQGHLSVAADVDLDGKSELVMGNGIYQFNGTSWVKESYFTNAAAADGFVAVADFGAYAVGSLPQGIAEVVVISSGNARVMSLSGATVFGPYALPSFPEGTAIGHGGPPTVGDFDGDGKPEFALAGKGAYTVFDFDCAGSPAPFGCKAPGILWSMQTQDYSSSVTGSSVFDFEADGLAEGIYADECFTRVYSGLSGDVLFSQPRTSCTWYENPVVADVDGDFKSEVVVGSNTNCAISCPSLDPMFRGIRCAVDSDCPGGQGSCKVGFCRCTNDDGCGGANSGYTCTAALPNTPGTGNVCRSKHWGKKSGIVVYRDRSDAWVDSRRIWNQHAYFVTNVQEDGHVPALAGAAQNWQTPGLNNFRQNVQGDYSGLSAPDLTVKPEFLTLCTDQGLEVPVQVCNRGSAPVDSGVAVAFFLGSAGPGGEIQCLLETVGKLFPGDCEPASCLVDLTPGSPPTDVVVVADFGSAEGDNTECYEGNNTAVFPKVDCEKIW
jgi:hypothetical protein